MAPVRVRCEDTGTISETIKVLGPFRAVIEASGTYRWLYDLPHSYGLFPAIALPSGLG